MATPETYDFVIIGSGVSGGVIAHELTAAGARCVLLEAGREFGASTFPDNEIDSSTQLFWGGGLEISTDGHLGLLRAKCVGGTSIVNQALLDRFDESAWSDWKDRSGIGFFNQAEMEPEYAACESRLSVSEIPRQYWGRNAKIFIDAFERQGHGWKPLRRAQKDCKLDHGSDCIVCLGGCPRDSKQSSLVTTIRAARARGLELVSGFEARRIEELADHVVVRGVSAAANGDGGVTEFRARRAVLAAGALGNSVLLLQSGFGPRLPALGTGFTCHPQFMTYALYDEPVNAHKGAFQAVKSEDAGLRARGFKLENVFAPPIATAMLLPGFGSAHHRMMGKYGYMASMEVAIRDEAVGKITAAKNGKPLIDKRLTDVDRRKAKDGLELVRGLFSAAGAKEIVVCPQVFGLHLMGGCPIGVDPKRAVIDPEFRVHGTRRLFSADSSVFPSAPGINPSFTIMAMSQRASRTILKEGKAS